jgi:hypothetical protein
MSHLLPHSASRDRQLPTAIAIITATSTKPTGFDAILAFPFRRYGSFRDSPQ